MIPALFLLFFFQKLKTEKAKQPLNNHKTLSFSYSLVATTEPQRNPFPLNNPKLASLEAA